MAREPELHTSANQMLAQARKMQSDGNFSDALEIYRGMTQKFPSDIECLLRMGAVLFESGKEDAAQIYLKRAAEIAPRDFRPLYNLVVIACKQSKLQEALAYAEEALRINDHIAEVHAQISDVFYALGRTSEGLHHANRASNLKPDNVAFLTQRVILKRSVCAWDEFESDDQRLKAFVASGHAVPPLSFMTIDSSKAEQLTCAKLWAQKLKQNRETKFVRRKPTLGRPFRVGYLSGDFHDHPTTRLVTELFEMHDRNIVTTYGYSYGPDQKGQVRDRVIRAFDHFIDVNQISTEIIARRIYEDEIDILVDMKGYTRNSRSEILIHRPAAIQVNYLGFPGTMGSDFVDYVITDRVVSPPSYQIHSAERFAYLPHCFQPNDTRRPRPNGLLNRAHFGLAEDCFVYCCFNGSYKITPSMFSTWMRILQAVPNSVLWLLTGSHEQTANLSREAISYGVQPERMIFAPVAIPEVHLERCALSDLFLDTNPVSAFTVASDALWAGLPVLTVAGSTPAGRGTMSLLHASNLPELVAVDLNHYEKTAIQLAQMPNTLQALRRRVGEISVSRPPFDTYTLARDLELLYKDMLIAEI